MSTDATPDRYAVLDEDATLTLQRLLPGPAQTVWDHLVDSELRSQWLAAGDMPTNVGDAFELVWRNDELTDPAGERPSAHAEENRLQTRLTEFDPPRRLSFDWGDTGGVTFDIEPRGDRVLLTIVHRRITDRDTQLSICAGWHTHADILAARLEGDSPAPFWTTHTRLRGEYEQRL